MPIHVVQLVLLLRTLKLALSTFTEVPLVAAAGDVTCLYVCGRLPCFLLFIPPPRFYSPVMLSRIPLYPACAHLST
jgi:hypothetical protein